MNWRLEKLYFKFLKHSGIFRYWYKQFLTILMYDLELHQDIEKEEIEEKYHKKLKQAEKL